MKVIQMHKTFTRNMKNFRIAKGLTQEQAAEKLNVNPQTVSRWECGTTLPDVLTLHEIAALYEVTVDDFYKKSILAYDNYAQRLASVYEKSRDPEDFMHCRTEYEKLIKDGELSTEDKWLYAWIHMYMMNYCRDIAVEWYDKAVSDNPENDPHNYQIACMQRIWMYFLLKKENEIIKELQEKTEAEPKNPRNIDNLIVALIWDEKFDEAYRLFSDAIEKFPEDWRIYIHGGDICKELKRYDEALMYYNKAGEIGTYFCDEMDGRANLYKETGEYAKAYNEYIKMAEIYRSRGYDVEAQISESYAEELKNKI